MWKGPKVSKVRRSGTKVRWNIFRVEDLPIEEQSGWYRAFERFLIDFLSNRKFLNEAEREQIAKMATQKYGLAGQGIPTAPQVAAVSSLLCKHLNIGESTFV